MLAARLDSLRRPAALIAGAIVLFIAAPLVLADATRPTTVERIRASHRIVFGYRTDARPFSYTSGGGRAAGYSIALCNRVADAVRHDLSLTDLRVDWMPLAVGDRFRALQEGRVDLLCAADTVTLARRTAVAFSIPIFPGGVGALVRADAPVRLREVLAGHGEVFQPIWRAHATQILQANAFTAVRGTTAEGWLMDRMDTLHVVAGRSAVDDYDAGVQALASRKADVFFGERAILIDAARRRQPARDVILIDRSFTYEPIALAMARGDEDFRLIVDRALSRTYRFGDIRPLYSDAFGEPDATAITFYRWNALPE